MEGESGGGFEFVDEEPTFPVAGRGSPALRRGEYDVLSKAGKEEPSPAFQPGTVKLEPVQD